jgi:hypothetical protein
MHDQQQLSIHSMPFVWKNVLESISFIAGQWHSTVMAEWVKLAVRAPLLHAR